MRARLVLSAFALLAVTSACHSTDPGGEPDGAITPPLSDAAGGCPTGKAGAGCILALYDRGCDALPELRAELDARTGLGPLWDQGRALFRTAAPAHVAGEFNGWSTDALATSAWCGSDLVLAVADVASGYWPYKLFDGQNWSLDPTNRAFAYDDFSGNQDGRNSLLATPDSGRGYVVSLDRACSQTLGNCRDVTAYLPPGYDALDNADRTYPVLFMHDGQNLWDDHDCCFGHTGWEVNITLDAEIAAGHVRPVVVVGAASTAARNSEYGLSQQVMTAFMQFQVDELQPHALSQVRWDGERVAVAGSSLGGLVAMQLALRFPDTYASGASLSGAFWPGLDDGTALLYQLPQLGKQTVAIYVDSGGDPTQNTDGAQDTIDVRDRMASMGWQRADSPACTPGPDALCYHLEPGATHDELAWKARAWRFLRFLFPG
jgi:predicted alpha/beta superfamily hydrolase